MKINKKERNNEQKKKKIAMRIGVCLSNANTL